jgi:hypothetical protein
MKHPGPASSCRLEPPVGIIVAPVIHQGRFTASLTDGSLLIASSRQPFFDGARQLIKLGYDPATVLVMRSVGSDIDCLTATVGAAAKLTVEESAHGPVFRSHRMASPSAVERPRSMQSNQAATQHGWL